MSKRIGILIHNNANLFSNGITQNAYFYKVCFEGLGIPCDFVCYETNPAPFGHKGIQLVSLNTDFKWSDYYIILCVTRNIHPDHYELCKAHNVRVIAFTCGNNFISHLEEFLHKSVRAAPNRTKSYDEAWIIPSFYEQKEYNSLWCDIPTFSVPHLWSPRLLEHRSRSLEGITVDKLIWKYKSATTKMVICSLDANQLFSKTSIVPLIAGEYIYMRNPDSVKHFYLANRPSNSYVNEYIGQLTIPIVSNKGYKEIDQMICALNNDDSFPILVFHQMHHSLNYLYYEAMYYGFPFVHNSPFLKEIGYYYEGANIEACARAILRAHQTHSRQWESMRDANMNYLKDIDPYDEDVQEYHKQLIMA